MSIYLVGDIQGCFTELKLLLDKAQFDSEKDQLWCAGDLVARGPDSLQTLRFIKDLGNAAKVVLGNHDLHLLAISLGLRQAKEKDGINDIFQAEDRDELLNWLKQQPLFLEHDDFVLCHAGISPNWDLTIARAAAKEIEDLLQSEEWPQLLQGMYADTPAQWDPQLTGIERYRYIINAFTRMRYCAQDGSLDMQAKYPPADMRDSSLFPWFETPNRVQLDKTVVFGHWAALQGYHSQTAIGLDTGCVWGGSLTMLRWDDQRYFRQAALT
ncbi:symmetrical bis(5'-nucleosyl)-tetraphosphatase [Vibrio profundum]|uniref:symmetrical bis(5'-nucleosyl)-tetraphosphatase n=1 Tax=Vibrio profundum TaxID=2910247 RepID=UPI003D0D7C91